MFNEKHKLNDKDNDGAELVFIKSSNVMVYPCGRRRSEKIDVDGNSSSVSDQYRIPFDPEARLNTEANNRKQSGLNGFTQTYLLSWVEDAGRTKDNKIEGYVELVVAGYYFKIKLDPGYTTPKSFGVALSDKLRNGGTENEAIHNIYANIRIDETPLFAGKDFITYKTSVLRNQNYESQTCLDILTTEVKLKTDDNYKKSAANNFENYYFSGISFSSVSIATIDGQEENIEIEDHGSWSVKKLFDANRNLVQRVFSIKLLDFVNTDWKIYNPALLPKISHGMDDDSVDVGILEADKIRLKGETSTSVPALKLKLLNEEKETWQMQFSSVDIDTTVQ